MTTVHRSPQSRREVDNENHCIPHYHMVKLSYGKLIRRTYANDRRRIAPVSQGARMESVYARDTRPPLFLRSEMAYGRSVSLVTKQLASTDAGKCSDENQKGFWGTVMLPVAATRQSLISFQAVGESLATYCYLLSIVPYGNAVGNSRKQCSVQRNENAMDMICQWCAPPQPERKFKPARAVYLYGSIPLCEKHYTHAVMCDETTRESRKTPWTPPVREVRK